MVIYLTAEKELETKIKNLILYKRELYIKQDDHKISSKKYEEEMENLNSEYNILVAEKIELLNKKLEYRNDEIETNQKKVIQRAKDILKPVRRKEPIQIQKVVKKPVIIKKVIKKQQPVTSPISVSTFDSTASYSSLIIKFLSIQKVDNEDKLVAVIKQLKPETEEHNLRRQIKNTISSIKNKTTKRFNGYVFNEQTYMVKEQCQRRLF